ncbi:SIR2 family NAD-dependent protein deacylase [Amycolatopsis regifaucium]|uniref:protein acetyllysine N-acetyltransferase n=1 Tax=Amycolatopsis regifaucium TaxID=546365 RepID=A0A154MMT7_9PSEU|nr:Sir2 family NAD-dependent protein deacetylase [Amycolatopsis regifaucium]KZB85585.1 NAD-dependent deacetylase [Amycolatopsis regifaucium]OKA10662.1 NAD-dependent deacetylase [Amycolatopsis regifaucium]SFI85857.1 NAD-dependent deacetylase [Amycolatopsis regifaucium]
MTATDPQSELSKARSLVAGAGRVVALTGAGISTDSGIPDFRGPQGLWTRDPASEKMSNLQAYQGSREVRERTWQARLVHPGWHAEPNAAHHALVRLEKSGTLTHIVTQNIDRLHQKAGSSPERVLELHGTMFESVCLSCDDHQDMRSTLDRVRAGETDPLCLVCGGILKSATISFGQQLDRNLLQAARLAVEACDLLLVAGSSLSVQPAAGLVSVASRTGAAVVICNGSETPYDSMAAVVLRGPLGTTLPALTP